MDNTFWDFILWDIHILLYTIYSFFYSSSVIHYSFIEFSDIGNLMQNMSLILSPVHNDCEFLYSLLLKNIILYVRIFHFLSI